ncbi:MAG TPA: pentapeptide repeat-containing protein [Pseudonocardiaceae bacterium]|jgi:hypothetical protein|nr:pentapeptide repeat-containing protein [Pseudonocardiaceae bacterium]
MEGKHDGYHVLSTRTILVWAAGLIVLACGAVVALLLTLGTGAPQDSARLDAIRTAGSILVGTGGAAALLLTARRQRTTELDLRQKDHDATERRVTELYGKAADQLGSDKAPVRLAGLYALERLAQDNAAHRQTIVNLVCAYLRMPFDPPEPVGRTEELEVRGIAQALLATHLRPGTPAFWPGVELNLSGATLVKFALTHCAPRSALFTGARFVGPTTFRGTVFAHSVDFRGARFTGLADFRRVTFGDDDRGFRDAVFEGEVNFGITTAAQLSGVVARGHDKRKWPAGWAEEPEGEPDSARLVHVGA